MFGIPHAIIRHRDGKGDKIDDNNTKENDPNIIENEGINTLIYDTFVAMDENAPANEIYEHIHDVPLIDKEQKPLYKYSKMNLLSILFLRVNLKVLNGV